MKKILITGASSGIGEATARELAKNGYTTILTARPSSLDKVKALSQKLNSEYKNGSSAYPLDVAVYDDKDADRVRNELLEITKHAGLPDIVCNNAGAGSYEEALNQSIGEFRYMAALNLHGPVVIMGHFKPLMLARGHGHIINASTIATVARPLYHASYVAAKTALEAVTEIAREEMRSRGEKGLDLSVIRFGLVDTPFFTKNGYKNNFDKRLLTKYAITPEQAAKYVLYAVKHPEKEIVHAPSNIATIPILNKISPKLSRWLIKQSSPSIDTP